MFKRQGNYLIKADKQNLQFIREIPANKSNIIFCLGDICNEAFCDRQIIYC